MTDVGDGRRYHGRFPRIRVTSEEVIVDIIGNDCSDSRRQKCETVHGRSLSKILVMDLGGRQNRAEEPTCMPI